MNYTNQHYEIAVTQLFGFGPIKTKQLLESVQEVRDLFEFSEKKLAELSGFDVRLLKKMERKKALLWSEKVVKDIEKYDIQTLFYTHPNYPRRLKQCVDAPLLLYTRGAINLNDSKFVAIVGTRNETEYGKRICKELIQSLEASNIIVVSGLAYGIDISVHKNCLKMNVPTVAVLAHGLEMVYPRIHQKTAKDMCLTGGLVTEFPPFTNPDRENFPMRNRIVAGLCDATIVIESQRKGGSLITAELANDYNRDVFAFPGSVFELSSEGCNRLIASNKAHSISNGADFLQKMGWNEEKSASKPVQKSIFPLLTDEEQLIVDLLQVQPEVSIDLIAMKLQMPISKLSVHLFQMEMSGILKPLPGNKCQLI